MAVFPDPPFFYKLFDDPDSDVFKELNVPPEIPDKRIVFGEEETDALPDYSIDDKRDSISCVLTFHPINCNTFCSILALLDSATLSLYLFFVGIFYSVSDLRKLNQELLSTFIDILDITKQPESYLFDLKLKRESLAEQRNKLHQQSGNPTNDDFKTNLDEPLIKYEESITVSNAARLQLADTGFQPSELLPLINDKCESLKVSFRAMRDILNSLRPHQAKQSIIQALNKQLQFKQNRLKQINENIVAGRKACNQELNADGGSIDEIPIESAFGSETDCNHMQDSIARLRLMLDDEFYK